VVSHLPEDVKQIFMLVAIPAMAVVLLARKNVPTESKPLTPVRLFACLATGLLVGFYDGFFGPGTGTLLILFLSWWAGMDYISAAGTAKLINLSSNVAALAKWITSGYVVYALAIPAIFCSVAGGYIGSRLALKRGAKGIRYVMLGVLALLVGKMAFNFFMK
jgi:uncharacterized membrane protein YfcA